MTGVRSCRKLKAACRDQIPYLWLTGWQHPDHNTLWRFYQRHRQGMRELFKRTVRTAVAMELVDLAVQAVDGTRCKGRRENVPRGRLDRRVWAVVVQDKCPPKRSAEMSPVYWGIVSDVDAGRVAGDRRIGGVSASM